MCVCVWIKRERKKLMCMYMYAKFNVHVHMYYSITPGTLQRMFLCYYSPLSRSHYWGCGSAPPPGPGLHSGWLCGRLLFTVLSVIGSIAMYYPLYSLHQFMLVILAANKVEDFIMLPLGFVGYYISNLLIKYKHRCKLRNKCIFTI